MRSLARSHALTQIGKHTNQRFPPREPDFSGTSLGDLLYYGAAMAGGMLLADAVTDGAGDLGDTVDVGGLADGFDFGGFDMDDMF